MEELTADKKYAFKNKEDEAKFYGTNGCGCKVCGLKRFHRDWERAQDTDSYQQLIDYLHYAKLSINIKDIATKRYGLKFKGNKTNCPFHKDSDPSFMIDTKENTFQCWSSNCGARGDVIEFIEQMEKKNECK